jgi:hypothetical protein
MRFSEMIRYGLTADLSGPVQQIEISMALANAERLLAFVEAAEAAAKEGGGEPARERLAAALAELDASWKDVVPTEAPAGETLQ